MILQPEGPIQDKEQALGHKSSQSCAVLMAIVPDPQKQQIWMALTQPGPNS